MEDLILMKTLIVDNYDSFTINLYQMVAEVNGTEPLVIPNDGMTWEELKKLNFDNIIISPGPGHPSNERDFGICRQIILEANIPLLGVCLGHQGLGYLYGSIVQRAPQVMHGRLSEIFHDGSELFQGIPSPLSVVRYHSLLVEEPLPKTLQRIAWTSDGILMGLKHQDKPFWGVQFHPESICTEYGAQLLMNFRDITRRFWDSKPARQESPIDLPEMVSIIPSGRPTPQESKCFKVNSRKVEFFRDVEDVFMGLYSSSPVAFWLGSSMLQPVDNISRFSFMGDASGSHSFLVNYRVESKELTISQNGTSTSRSGDIFDFLSSELDRRYYRSDDLPFDFNSGFVGYFGYELKADCGGQNKHTSPLPDSTFLFADRLIAFDHQEHVIYLVCLTENDGEKEAVAWFDETENQLRNLSPAPDLKPESINEPVLFELSRSKERYLQDIESCFKEIEQGESYELCLTNLVRTSYRPDPITLYRTLRKHNPAPYAAFLRLNEISVVCSSPERFLRIDKDRWVESKPIKGTCRRGETPEKDWILKENLRRNEKDRAENLMIVDLLRNDLGIVCEVGTVSVPKLMNIESYETVHQMVSTVRGRLRSEINAAECVRAAFPGGSMTGAPKKRTMEIIDQLEAEARGVYSGSIGYLGLSGTADLNIVIRTAVISPIDTTIGTGGAIVALSDPDAEFEETMLKARALIQAILLTAGVNVREKVAWTYKAA
jgi:para-aminobenzoate synthetase